MKIPPLPPGLEDAIEQAQKMWRMVDGAALTQVREAAERTQAIAKTLQEAQLTAFASVCHGSPRLDSWMKIAGTTATAATMTGISSHRSTRRARSFTIPDGTGRVGGSKLRRVELEISPEPDEEGRDAIEAALQRLLRRDSVPPAYASAWRKAGLRSAVDPQALARPRSSRGATRA